MIGLGLLLSALGMPAVAASPTMSVSELTHCAQITAIDQRLACYDTLAASKMATTVPAPAAAKPGTAAAAAGAAAAASPVTVPTPPPPPAGGFGMSTHVAPVEQGVQQVNAHVLNGSVDRQGNVYVALDNGQTWTYVDRDGPPEIGDEVEIRRASLGSYLLTANHHTFRAQRTK
jgi:hypothetical protein